VPLVAVPNISEGRNERFVNDVVAHIEATGAGVIDVHSDARHNRSVLTIVAPNDSIVSPLVSLALRCRDIDLDRHEGAHPRLGGLDVCPVVPFRTSMGKAVAEARSAAGAIAEACGLPVYLYGEAALREATRELPDLRRGGLAGLIARSAGLPPDFGPEAINPSTGVVCVGARGPLIAFNVWLEATGDVAREIAEVVREKSSGLAGLRALGIDLGGGTSQVSMNLTKPEETGIDRAFHVVSEVASSHGVTISKTEIVGLIEERFVPDPKKEAARLLLQPGRTLESATSID
jgi:glutamate formiminotransferase